jgi:hypothetical protein
MASEIESMKDGENFNPQAFGCVVARFLVPSWMLTSKEGGAEQNAGRSSPASVLTGGPTASNGSQDEHAEAGIFTMRYAKLYYLVAWNSLFISAMNSESDLYEIYALCWNGWGVTEGTDCPCQHPFTKSHASNGRCKSICSFLPPFTRVYTHDPRMSWQFENTFSNHVPYAIPLIKWNALVFREAQCKIHVFYVSISIHV